MIMYLGHCVSVKRFYSFNWHFLSDKKSVFFFAYAFVHEYIFAYTYPSILCNNASLRYVCHTNWPSVTES